MNNHSSPRSFLNVIFLFVLICLPSRSYGDVRWNAFFRGFIRPALREAGVPITAPSMTLSSVDSSRLAWSEFDSIQIDDTTAESWIFPWIDNTPVEYPDWDFSSDELIHVTPIEDIYTDYIDPGVYGTTFTAIDPDSEFGYVAHYSKEEMILPEKIVRDDVDFLSSVYYDNTVSDLSLESRSAILSRSYAGLQAIPEPSSMALLGIAAIAVGLRCRTRNQQRR